MSRRATAESMMPMKASPSPRRAGHREGGDAVHQPDNGTVHEKASARGVARTGEIAAKGA
jgi:hypothetical protein